MAFLFSFCMRNLYNLMLIDTMCTQNKIHLAIKKLTHSFFFNFRDSLGQKNELTILTHMNLIKIVNLPPWLRVWLTKSQSVT